MMRRQLNDLVKEFKTQLSHYHGIWKAEEVKEEGVRCFLNRVNASSQLTSCITNDSTFLRYFKGILKELTSKEAVLDQKVNRMLNILPEDEPLLNGAGPDIFNSKKTEKTEKKEMTEKKEKIEKIEGEKLSITINFNPERMNINYRCNGYDTNELLKRFIDTQIPGMEFIVDSPKRSLLILDGKRYTQNQYTDAYLFDPFFNSLNFQLKRVQGQFTTNFQVVHPQQIKLNLYKNNSPKYWLCDEEFNASSKIEDFIDYICRKERAGPEVKRELTEQLTYHGIAVISDLMKFPDVKELTKLIKKQKWACQLLIEFRKIQGESSKSSFNAFKNYPAKMETLRQAYSHKILRYLFFKANNEQLDKLNFSIPYLNEDTVNSAIAIVKKELVMDRMDDIAEFFNNYSYLPKEGSKNKIPHGALFYGPPGTGKTRLTEDLAELMGFHLISKGVSSSNFMKEFVGGAKGTVEGYFIRANESPHLICSIAIDEIDPLIAKREEGGGKGGSNETIGKFLAMMGGNESVPNLLVVGSTNLFNKIDDAMIRRFNSNFYIGLPSKEERKKILQFYNPHLQQIGISFDYLVSITPNFSGAGLEVICQRVTQKEQQRQRGEFKWTNKELVKQVHKVAKSLKLFFGDQTYPELAEDLLRNKLISLSFLNCVQNQTVFFIPEGTRVSICYLFEQTQFTMGQIRRRFHFCKSDVPFASRISTEGVAAWLREGGDRFEALNSSSSQELTTITRRFRQKAPTRDTVIFHKLTNQAEARQQIKDLKSSQESIPHLYYCFLMDLDGVGKAISQSDEGKRFKGRMLVDLSREYPRRMEFEVECSREDSELVSKPFIKKNMAVQSQVDYFAEVVEELTPRNLSFIQLIDSSFFATANIFQEEQSLTLIQSKIQEAKQYQRSAIIIDVDSIIKLNKSINKDTTSLSIDRPNLYRELLNIAVKLPKHNAKKELWVVLIVRDQDLVKLIKRDIAWPLSAEEKMETFQQNQKEAQEDRDRETKNCKHCCQFFTEENNKRDRSCEIHYGQVMRIDTGEMMEGLEINVIKFNQAMLNSKLESKRDHFLYSCCWQNINANGCKRFKHCAGGPGDEDEMAQMSKETKFHRTEMCKRLKTTSNGMRR